MLYTLYYQKSYGDMVVITRSKSLLKLLKIKFMTSIFLHINDSNGHECSMTDLESSDYLDYRNFRDRVYGGKYFKSYDYIQRVRYLLNRRA